jgi:hypothetical protein
MKCRYCGCELSPKVLAIHEPICKKKHEQKQKKQDKEKKQKPRNKKKAD